MSQPEPKENERPSFAVRLQRMRSRRYEEWWHIVCWGPIGTVLAAVIADVRAITPNGVTCFALLGRLVACWLLVEQTQSADIAAVVLIQVTGILDIVDGSLARYRKMSSYEGAFLDKVSDSIALAAFLLAAGYRGSAEAQELWPLVAAAFMAAGFALRERVFWMTRFFELEHAGGAEPASVKPGWGDLSFAGRWRYYASQSYRFFAVAAAEVYLAVSVAVLVGELEWTLYGLAALTGIWFLITVSARYLQARRLDRRPREGE
jgi:phosphatidylglycerophosphate synthase